MALSVPKSDIAAPNDLQDPEYTKVLIVVETTLSASALQDDLRRAYIESFAWVINGSLAAAQPRDSVLQARATAEIQEIPI